METFKAIGSFLGTCFVYLLGGLDIAMQFLLFTIIADYITGLMKSYKSDTLNSEKGLKGIIKKVGVLCLVALAYMVDRVTGESGIIRTATIYYLATNESLSIIENLGEMNIIVPEFLKEKLEQLKTPKK